MTFCFSAIGNDAAVHELPKAAVPYFADLAFLLVLSISPSLFPFSSFVLSIFRCIFFPGRLRLCQRSGGEGPTGFAIALEFLPSLPKEKIGGFGWSDQEGDRCSWRIQGGGSPAVTSVASAALRTPPATHRVTWCTQWTLYHQWKEWALMNILFCVCSPTLLQLFRANSWHHLLKFQRPRLGRINT